MCKELVPRGADRGPLTDSSIRVAQLILVLPLLAFAGPDNDVAATDELRVMAWNIWHGGREDGEEVGPQRVIDVINDSGADLVAMQETYGSGERIAQALKFNFHPRGTNVSIHSRYPILEDISVFEEFKCVGALIELPDRSRVAFYSIWLPYDAEIWEAGTRDSDEPATMLAACDASARSLNSAWAEIQERLSAPEYANVPIIVAGDFNSMSHLDYGEVGVDQYQAVVDWPTSHILTDVGFRDSYRECNPLIDRALDSTWSPRFPDQEQDRIDFIYYRPVYGTAQTWRASESRVIRLHTAGFPSDHAALLSTLRRSRLTTDPESALRAASYNIRHGEGLDGELDLKRSASVLDDLQPDFVGLQEVDLGVARSGGTNQVMKLADMLGLHPAFGGFMDYQGGRYGMALLSRYPIVDVRTLDLPVGDEPRVALLAEVRLLDGRHLALVNVHFDWIDDDANRFAQASRLVEHLSALDMPYILLGDFNDTPGSRTLELFRPLASQAQKPRDDHFTFSAARPEREIDYIFHAPPAAWHTASARVIHAPVASDHRPVCADLRLRTE